jgi:PhnB protein
MAIKGARGEDGRITPHLMVPDASAAVDFYVRAFGARERYRSPLPGGRGLHVHLTIAQTLVMITEEDPANRIATFRSPRSLGGTSTIFELYVPDADAAFERALEAGAEPALPLSDTFWGDRYGWVADPFGYIWALATAKEELTPDEVKARMDALFAGPRL